MTITGTSGNDDLTGTSGKDIFDLSQGGNDRAQGLGGNDVFEMGAALNTGDRIDGGDGDDVVQLDGDYSAGLAFSATTLLNVETISLAAGNSYKLTTNDATVAAGQRLTVNASALGTGDTLTFKGSHETDGQFTLIGGAGADVLTGGALGDKFDLSLGGDDVVAGGAGNDVFDFGAQFTAADRVDGGAGSDVVRLSGDYSAGLLLSATNLTSVETIALSAGFSYRLTTDDANVPAGGRLTVNASQLGASDSLNFNGSSETNGAFSLYGGAGDDVLRGGAGNDFISLGGGANDRALGGGGDDTIQVGTGFTALGKIDGGEGFNTVIFDGDFSGDNAIIFAATSLINIQALRFDAGHSYDLTANDSLIALSGQTMTVDAHRLGPHDSLTFDASLATEGHFHFIGGAGDDDLRGDGALPTFVSGPGDIFDLHRGGDDFVIGGRSNDTFVMGGAMNAADSLNGGGGSDTVVLDGDYTGANTLTLLPGTLQAIQTLLLSDGHSYRIEGENARVGIVQMNVGVGHTVVFDDSLAPGTPGASGLRYDAAGSGHYVLTGGDGGDFFNVTTAGRYTVDGGGGNDQIDYGTNFGAGDHIDGGDGNDSVEFSSTSPIVFNGTQFKSIEEFILDNVSPTFTYHITTTDSAVLAGSTFSVSFATTNEMNLDFDGSAETDGHFSISASFGNDVLVGGAQSDTFTAGGGSDTITGGGGGDEFNLSNTTAKLIYNAVSDSTGVNYDIMGGLNFNSDRMQIDSLGALPSAIDPLVTGASVSRATFDSDMQAAVGASQLAAGHAVEVRVDSGDLKHRIYLIVDENGVAGYQSGHDLIFEVDTTAGTLATAFFT